MDGKTLKERILKIEPSMKRVSDKIGITPQALNQALNAADIKTGFIEVIAEAYPGVNKMWLLTGEGDMLKNNSSNTERVDSDEAESSTDYRLIPLINIDSVGGVYSHNLLTPAEQFIERLIPFTGAKEGDRAIYQSGESMMPTIPPGSILQIRRVDDWQEYFGYGGTFVLWLRDERRITKQVMRYKENSDEYVICHSHNPEYGDERLPKRLIQEVWKVIKVLTDKGW